MNDDGIISHNKIKNRIQKKLREKENTRCHLTNSVEMLCMRAVNVRETELFAFLFTQPSSISLARSLFLSHSLALSIGVNHNTFLMLQMLRLKRLSVKEQAREKDGARVGTADTFNAR